MNEKKIISFKKMECKEKEFFNDISNCNEVTRIISNKILNKISVYSHCDSLIKSLENLKKNEIFNLNFRNNQVVFNIPEKLNLINILLKD